jgi:hypothetical protein
VPQASVTAAKKNLIGSKSLLTHNEIKYYVILYIFLLREKKCASKRKSSIQKVLSAITTKYYFFLIIFCSSNFNFKKLLFFTCVFFPIVFFSAKYNFLMLSKNCFKQKSKTSKMSHQFFFFKSFSFVNLIYIFEKFSKNIVYKKIRAKKIHC